MARIAGGGEDAETPLEAATREAFEEAGIPASSTYIALDSVASIPAHIFPDSSHWGDSVYVVTEHAFGVDVSKIDLHIGDEHAGMQWLGFDEAIALLRYDSNRIALWELDQRIHKPGSRDDLRDRCSREC